MTGDRILRGLAALACACVLASRPCDAQVASDIAADGSLGTAINPAGNVFNIDGGTAVGGANLFHSFARFTVGTGDIAVFNGPASIQNIIGRVSGGDVSTIDGVVASSIAGANLFLVNPAGILFGPNASIAVDGSFHASTADYLELADGGLFFAAPGATSSLTVAPVASFGFLSANPAPITLLTPISPDANSPRVGTPGLQVPTGATISIVGGRITAGAEDGSSPAYVLAPAGNIRIASVAGPGEAALGADGAVDVSSFAALGTVRLQGSSLLDAASVVIRAARIESQDATILPGAFASAGFPLPPPDGGTVDLEATESIALRGVAPDPVFGAPTGILVFAGIDPIAPLARVPDVRLSAPAITLSGPAGITTNRFGAGAAGNVTLQTDTLVIEDGASVSLVNAFEGDGGRLQIMARDILLDGADSEGFTGLAAQSVFNPAYLTSAIDAPLSFADSGRIDIAASGQVTLLRGAQVSTDARSYGASGDITISAANVTIDASRVLAQSAFAGDSGDVSITATGTVALTGGAVVSAATFGGGDGGTVTIAAGQHLVIAGEASGIASQATPLPQPDLDAFAALVLGAPGAIFQDLVDAFGLPAGADLLDVLGAMNDFGIAAVPADRLTPGNGGDIVIVTPALDVAGLNAAIDSSTATDGNAGNVRIETGTLDLGAGATIGSRSGIPDLVTGEIFVGAGAAGSVDIVASGDATIAGEGATVSTDTRGAGDAGDVSIAAFRLFLRDGGTVSSSSGGDGLAGNITLTLGDSLRMDDGVVATEAVSSDGGNITVLAPRLVELIDSEITTSVGTGQGNGGNILIDPDFVVLQGSRIVANAFGGAGGNIDIIAGFLIVSPDSVIDASSALGVDGFVRTTAPDTDVSASLAVLPASYLDAASQLQAGCGAARAGQSSLTQVGRGGLPVDPGGYLPSAPVGATAVPVGSAGGLYEAQSLAGLDDLAQGCAL